MKTMRVLCLAIATALAVTAFIGTASASARAGFEAKAYPAHITGTESITGSRFHINGVGYEIDCFGMNFVAEEGKLPITTLKPSSIETPSCQRVGGGTASLKFNQCKLEFSPVSSHEGLEDQFDGDLAIGPSGCGTMVLNFTVFGEPCELTFAPQQVSGVTYDNVIEETTPYVKIVPSAALSYTATGRESLCGKSTGTATFFANWSVKADVSKVASPLKVVDPIPIPIYLTEGKFGALAYPIQIVGNQSTQQVLKFGGSPVTCSKVSFNSTEVNGETETLLMFPVYTGCHITFAGIQFNAEVHPNFCYYALHSTGVVDIDCWFGGGESIEVKVPEAACSFHIAPQTGFSGSSISGSGELSLSLNLSGIAYTASKPESACGASGTGTDGKYTGGSGLLGYY